MSSSFASLSGFPYGNTYTMAQQPISQFRAFQQAMLGSNTDLSIHAITLFPAQLEELTEKDWMEINQTFSMLTMQQVALETQTAFLVYLRTGFISMYRNGHFEQMNCPETLEALVQLAAETKYQSVKAECLCIIGFIREAMDERRKPIYGYARFLDHQWMFDSEPMQVIKVCIEKGIEFHHKTSSHPEEVPVGLSSAMNEQRQSLIEKVEKSRQKAEQARDCATQMLVDLNQQNFENLSSQSVQAWASLELAYSVYFAKQQFYQKSVDILGVDSRIVERLYSRLDPSMESISIQWDAFIQSLLIDDRLIDVSFG